MRKQAMSFRAHWRSIMAASLALAGVIAAAYAFSSLQHRRTITPPTPRVTEQTNLADGELGPSSVNTDEFLRSTAITVSEQAERIGLRDASSLGADATAVLGLWLDGSIEDYRAYLDERGYGIPESPLWSDPQKAEQLWQRLTVGFRSGSFDSVGALVRVKYQDGHSVASNDLGPATTGWRLDKLPDIQRPHLNVEQLASRKVDLYEVIIPFRQFPALRGTKFDGHLGLSYGWDRERSQWAMVQMTIYGIPNGEAVSPPPF